MTKINKQNPNGTLNAEYVEALFEEFPDYEREKLIKRLADKYILEEEEVEKDDSPSLDDVINFYSAEKILDELDMDDILEYINMKIDKDDIKEYFEIGDDE